MAIIQQLDQLLLPAIGYGGALCSLYCADRLYQASHTFLARASLALFFGFCIALRSRGMI